MLAYDVLSGWVSHRTCDLGEWPAMWGVQSPGHFPLLPELGCASCRWKEISLANNLLHGTLDSTAWPDFSSLQSLNLVIQCIHWWNSWQLVGLHTKHQH